MDMTVAYCTMYYGWYLLSTEGLSVGLTSKVETRIQLTMYRHINQARHRCLQHQHLAKQPITNGNVSTTTQAEAAATETYNVPKISPSLINIEKYLHEAEIVQTEKFFS